MKSDELGDRMKAYEQRETDRRFMNFIPVIARMDGRGFSRWTRGLRRPYDENLSQVMIEVTRQLVKETGARIGYTQSDEITLVMMIDEVGRKMMFDGKAQKLCSILASLTTSCFLVECMKRGGELAERAMRGAQFDARIFQVPSRTEAANAVLWREQDAVKNAITMAARSFYEHADLQGKSGIEMQAMMLAKGQDFNDYPSFFRRGSFLQVRSRTETLPEDVLTRIGVDRNDVDQAVFTRRSIERIEMPAFAKVVNREDVIFESAEPEIETAEE